MSRLNYHHLQYFHAVAKEGSLTRAAAHLHVTQSALSAQIRQLEEQLGLALFDRVGRGLQLTEAGRLALGYADRIFATGTELVAMLREGPGAARQVLRVGAVATLSRNFTESFLRPLLDRDDVELVLQSGGQAELMTRLRVHTLDVVLANRRVQPAADEPWRCRRLARQPVSLVGQPRPRGGPEGRFPDVLRERPLLLPGRDSEIRAGFDLLCEQLGIRYRLRAEVDDMALLRLLARDSDSLALVPSVVVRDELQAGRLAEVAVVPDLHEQFYAITVERQYAPPLLKALLKRPESDVLDPLVLDPLVPEPRAAAPEPPAPGRRARARAGASREPAAGVRTRRE